MAVDSFKYLPRMIATFYKMTEREPKLPIPWTPLTKPLSECKFGLVTSGGFYQEGVERPFNITREKEEPTWGDPSYRTIPTQMPQSELGVSQLHINTQHALTDMNVLLPIQQFQELVVNGRIGSLADEHYAVMGFQGFPADTTIWEKETGPAIAQKFKQQGVDCVLLTPA